LTFRQTRKSLKKWQSFHPSAFATKLQDLRLYISILESFIIIFVEQQFEVMCKMLSGHCKFSAKELLVLMNNELCLQVKEPAVLNMMEAIQPWLQKFSGNMLLLLVLLNVKLCCLMDIIPLNRESVFG
jgi:hypothetical protein